MLWHRLRKRLPRRSSRPRFCPLRIDGWLQGACQRGGPRLADRLAPVITPFEHDLAVHNHIADHPLPDFWERLSAIPEAIVRNHIGIEFSGEREDEVVGIRTGGSLSDRTILDEPFELIRLIDPVAQRGIHQYHRFEAVLAGLSEY